MRLGGKVVVDFVVVIEIVYSSFEIKEYAMMK